MRVFVLKDEKTAIDCRQLIRLKADCGRLEWSKTIKKTTADVMKALSVIEDFVDEKLEECCSNSVGAYTVSEKEETQIFTALKKNATLRELLGSGVVLKSELKVVEENLIEVDVPTLKEVIATGKSFVIV